jgi:hypothetical protein
LTKLRKLKPPPLRYDSAGGNGELKKLVDLYLHDDAWAGIPRRIVVFTDSDAKVTGRPSQSAREVEKYCRDNNVPCLVLSKRAIENYIPDAALEAWVNRPGCNDLVPRFEALKRLTRVQRDHYPLKEGFGQTRKDGKPLSADERAFYQGVQEDDMLTLDEGFTTKLVNCMRDHTAPERPASSITVESLRARDRNGELERLVDIIEGEL